MKFFEDNRKQSIESLQFFFFLGDIYFSLLEKDNSENSLIQEFIDAVGKNYYWQSYKIQNYLTSLSDHVFWESSEIYLKSMQKFVSHELSGSEFVSTIFFRILNDRKESNLLKKDFEKQARLELNPKIFQFSEIISNLDLALEAFNEEDSDCLTEDEVCLTEDQLRKIVKEVLPKVEKYFTDEI